MANSVVEVFQRTELLLDVETSGSRRYLKRTPSIATVKPTLFRNQKQDEFVKNGARAKALLTTVFRAVAEGLASNAADDSDGEDGGEDRNLVPRTTRMIVNFAERHGTLRLIFPMFGTSLKRRQKNAWH